MNEPISIKHSGAEILYCESSNRWSAFIDGAKIAERATLKDARAAVDALQRAEKKPAFTRHTALLSSGYSGAASGGLEVINVTSYCVDEGGRPTSEAWIGRPNPGKYNRAREKVEVRRLYEDCTENHRVNERIKALRKAEQKLADRREELAETLTPYKVRS